MRNSSRKPWKNVILPPPLKKSWTSTLCAGAPPSSDLASPSQAVRDAAAKILRATYTPPARTNWDLLIAQLKSGAPKTNVLELIRPYNLGLEGGVGSGYAESERYRLDDLWLLECSYRGSESNMVLFHWEPREALRNVWVEPPPGFTGEWTTYYVNGQKVLRAYYKNGIHDGAITAFQPDGSLVFIQHVAKDTPYGEETGFYASGKTNYHGSYKEGARIGTWIWYNEDGSIKSKH